MAYETRLREVRAINHTRNKGIARIHDHRSRAKKQQLIDIRRAAAQCLLFSEQLEAKQLPEDGKGDQHKRVDCHDHDQFIAAFLANDGSTHGASPFNTHSVVPMCLGCSTERML